jgi:hypothetical protein
MHNPSSWYDTALGEAHRRVQPSVAEVVTEQATRPRIDPYVSGLARALAVGAGRVPLIP